MKGLVLDKRGHPEQKLLLGPSGIPARFEESIQRGWQPLTRETADAALDRAPQHILDLLEKAAGERQHRIDNQSALASIMGAGNFYNQPLSWIIADGTQILNTTTEAILVPSFTLPAGYLFPGSTLRYTVYFDQSTVVTTPGTITQRLRYNGTGGTALATSGAFAGTTTVKTTLTVKTEYLLTCRTIGTAGTVMVMGHTILPNIDPTSAATIAANLAMWVIPVSGAATAAVNTTTANTLDPTWQSSVATATTQATAHLAILESLV